MPDKMLIKLADVLRQRTMTGEHKMVCNPHVPHMEIVA
ncbi:hypothetical protein JAB1_34470 [Janthinobacterium sp. MP5059B]|nr:hypothetical protein JAB1_34470 [Janthinobacterium sp. MP5059B]